MKKALFVASLFCVLIAGCSWNDDEYQKYVNDDGSVTQCPVKGQAGSLLYIEVTNKSESGDSALVPQGDKDIIRCAQTCPEDTEDTDDPSSKIGHCVPLTDIRCKDYSGSFEHKLCPRNTECLSWQNDTSIWYCGRPIKECNTSADCSNVDGWQAGDCQEDKCIATACKANYHLLDNGKCELDTVEHCGKDRINCAQTEGSTKKTKSFECQNATCVPIICEVTYHLASDGNIDSCVEDDVDSCGGIVCSDSNEGWGGGDCITIKDNKAQPVKSQCNASSCKEGYHLIQRTITIGDEKSGEEPATASYYLCEIDDDEHCGGAKSVADMKDITSENCKTKFKSEGAELYYCKKEEQTIDSKTIIHSSCQIAKCAKGYHWNKDNTICEPDSVLHCGSFNNDCSKVIAGSEPGSLICTSEFTCVTTACKSNYFHSQSIDNPSELGLEASVAYYSECIPYTNETCGFKDDGTTILNCNDDNNNGEFCVLNESSEAGKQIYSCSVDCSTSLTFCPASRSCVNTQTDPKNCGRCGNTCSNIPAAETSCTQGHCESKCIGGFLDCNQDLSKENGDGCESDKNALNLKECKECADGYGNCDKNWENGCEINLADYGLESCEKCRTGLTNCGYINGTTIPLCLEKSMNGNSWGGGSPHAENDPLKIDWAYTDEDTDEDNNKDHICQWICNFDYGITLREKHLMSDGTSQCYVDRDKIYHRCGADNTEVYWTNSATCKPKQKCYLKKSPMTFTANCAD